MFLVESSLKEVSKWRSANNISGPRVTELAPNLLGQASAYQVVNSEGKKIAYALVIENAEDIRYSSSMVEVAAAPDLPGGLFRLLPNVMRSLHVEHVLARSDDLESLRLMTHFVTDIHHLFQIYEIPEHASGNGVKVELTKLGDANEYNKYLSASDFNVFAPDVFDAKEIETVYEASSGKKKLGMVVVQKAADDGQRRIIPLIRSSIRRNKWGSAVTLTAGNMIRNKGNVPVTAVKAEDDVSLGFINYLKAKPVVDLLKIKPSFHLKPTSPVWVED